MVDPTSKRGLERTSARRPPPDDTPRLRPDPDMPSHQRRLIRAIGRPAARVLPPDEEILAVTEAVEDAPRSTRVVLGASWAPSRRVGLLFTARRLVEIGLSPSGRRARGRVRSFPWDGIPSLLIEDDHLEVRSWDGALHRWFLRDVPEPEIEGRLNRRVNLAVSTFVPSRTRNAPLRHCTACGKERPEAEENCRFCGATVRTPRLASRLALAFPGGGHLYAGRPVGSVIRFLFETAIFAGLALLVLGTTNPWQVLAMVVAGSGVLGVVKLHGAWSARVLSSRAGAVTTRAARLWKWSVPIGLTLSIASLLAPLTMVGALEREVRWDLWFIDSTEGWHPVRPGPGDARASDDAVRAVWSNGHGQRVVIRSWPFPPFHGADRVMNDLGRRPDVADEPSLIGAFTVLEATHTNAGGETAVGLLVIDPDGRDVHSIALGSEPGGEDQARDRLRWLLGRAIWVKHPSSD